MCPNRSSQILCTDLFIVVIPCYNNTINYKNLYNNYSKKKNNNNKNPCI